MKAKKLFKIIGVGLQKFDKPAYCRMSIRTNGAAFCGGCGDKIERGEQYFMVNYPVCLGCAKYE